MTLTDINTLLSSIAGFEGKVAYYAFPEDAAPCLPFICYYEDESDNFAADGIVYHPILRVTIELYSRHKDTQSEALIEAALTEAGIYWEKNETYIDTEKVFMETYEIEV